MSADESTPAPAWLCLSLSELSPRPVLAVRGATHLVAYLNPAFARLVGRVGEELIGRPFAEAVPGWIGWPALLDRVVRTSVPETLAEQENPRTPGVYWTYSAWAIHGPDGLPAGVVVEATDATESADFRRRAVAVNEALVVSSIRQHELAAASDASNTELRRTHDDLESRVRERTAELTRTNAELSAEIARREQAEDDRRGLLVRLEAAREDERRRIARELHDQMGQHLAALSLGLRVVRDAGSDSPDFRGRLRGLQEMTDRLGREIHRLALELRPPALDDLGLPAALANYAEDWSERSGVEIDAHVGDPDSARMPADIETALYRVVQEALTNVLKHASARHVSLLLRRSVGQVQVVVEDDGGGFDPEQITDGRLGMLGMRERLALVGGTLTVEASPGRGCTLIARVPLSAEGGADA